MPTIYWINHTINTSTTSYDVARRWIAQGHHVTRTVNTGIGYHTMRV